MNRNNKIFLAVTAVIGLVLVGYAISAAKPALMPQSNNPANTQKNASAGDVPASNVPSPSSEMDESASAPSKNPVITVKITDTGFDPRNVSITQGNHVTWINDSSSPTWPASAVHPTHTLYPGSSIELCGTAEAAKIFDACEGIAPGESWSFTFDQKGIWNYHDHLNPGRIGSVSVD